MSRPARNQVFISYSHADNVWLQKLLKMYRPLERSNKVTAWADTAIKPGQKWQGEIEKALASAKVAVLLVSANFFNSDFIVNHELPVLEAAEREGLRVLWVSVGYCLFEKTQIAAYQCTNDPKRPLVSLSPSEQEAALLDICRQIEEAALSKTGAELDEEEVARLRAEIKSATARRDWGGVVRHAEALLNLRPSDTEAMTVLTHAGRKELEAAYENGRRHLEEGNLTLALKQLRELRDRQGDYKDVEALVAHIERTIKEEEARLRAEAQAAAESHEWAAAVKSLDALLSLRPMDEEVRLKLAEARRKQAGLEGAYREGVSNLQHKPEAALRHLLDARRLGGNYKDVDALIADAKLKIPSRQEEAGRLRAEAASAMNEEKWADAVGFLIDLKKLAPDDPAVTRDLRLAEEELTLRRLYKTGVGKYQAGRLDEALEDLHVIRLHREHYRDVPALITKIENKRAREKVFSTLKYYSSLTLGLAGAVIAAYSTLNWAQGYAAQLGWAWVVSLTAGSWLSLGYSLWLSAGRRGGEALGCLGLAAVILIPILSVVGWAFIPEWRVRLAHELIENASDPTPGKAEQIVGEMTRAININPRDALAYHYRGWAYRLKGDYEQAVADARRAIELDPARDDFFISRGRTFYLKRDHDKALADFTEAIRLNPAADNYHQRGKALFDLKDYGRAVADFDRAAKAKPDSEVAFDYLGRAYHAAGDHAAALKSLNEAIKINPNYPAANLHRGQVYAAVRDFDRAVADFDRAVTLDENLAAAYLERGKAYLNRDDPDYNQAIIDLGKAIKKDANSAEAYFNRGVAYEKGGDAASAAADFRKVLEFADPALSEEARLRLRNLDARK
jgi:tetratricopeptide (TPR) repeat protein